MDGHSKHSACAIAIGKGLNSSLNFNFSLGNVLKLLDYLHRQINFNFPGLMLPVSKLF